jgi:transcriptional regulator with XRE-family HTH domain
MSDGPPDPIDVQVGKAVRERRITLGLSQTEIADALGLTFQQVQKYEKASNRISASKLYALANILKVPVYYFFQGMDVTNPPGVAESAADYQVDLAAQRDLREMSRLLTRIDNPAARRQLLDLAKTLADMGDSQPSVKE